MTKEQIEILLHFLLEKPLAFHPVFAKVLGGVNAALFFQQIFYWSDKGSREDGYIYKTKKKIEEETTLTPRQQDLVRKPLEEAGIIITKLIKVNGSPTLHYKVCYEKLHEEIIKYYKVSESSISENTSKKRALSPAGEKHPFSSRKGKVRDERVLRVIEAFRARCLKDLRIEIRTGVKELHRIKQLLVSKIPEDVLLDMIDFWFRSDLSDDKTCHLMRAFSDTQINYYYVHNRR